MNEVKSKRVRATLGAVLIALLVAGCSDRNEERTVIRYKTHCLADSKEARANFILQCISNANPKSDEEPEDWIRQCQKMAEETYCDSMPVEITQVCGSSSGCFWPEISRKPVGN